MKDIQGMASYYTDELLQKRPLEEISIINNTKFSLLEKTSVKLLPIIKTIVRRMAFEDDSLPASDQNNKENITRQQ